MNDDIYVHNNPSNIKYNAYLLLFMRSWYMPTKIGEPVKNDTWLRVPAVKSQRYSDPRSATYTCVNGNLELVSVMSIAEDSAKLTKIARGRPGKILQPFRVSEILREAVDISEWEYTQKQSWPYGVMFDTSLIQYRFKQKYGDNRAAYMDPTSDNIVFMEIRKTVLPKPCGCGRAKYITNK
jgi:hypothetical protein